MLKVFPIDFVRQALEQKLLLEHIKDINLFGGKEQVAISSFYEQLKSQDEINRFVETYRDLTNQQNRSGLILNGVLLSPENPTITNLYSSLIVPLTWTCSMRTMLQNRDQSIATINNLIDELKGRKVDVAQLNCIDDFGKKYSTPFVVGTIGQGYGKPKLKDYDFLGDYSLIHTKLNTLYSQGVELPNLGSNKEMYFYADNSGKIKVVKATSSFPMILDTIDDVYHFAGETLLKIVCELDSGYSISDIKAPIELDILLEEDGEYVEHHYESNIYSEGEDNKIHVGFDLGTSEFTNYEIGELIIYGNTPVANDYETTIIEDDGTYQGIVFPPEHIDYEKYKLSLSFDAIRCDEPRNLNANEYCELTFGGSATLVSEKVKLGNDLLKVSFQKNKIVAETNITFTSAPIYYLEPLEMPSSNSANTKINQLVSNNFKTNTHTDGIALNLQYTFILDESIDLLSQWYKYGRYGTFGISVNDISPNMIYSIDEYWSSWGNYEKVNVLGKIIESIDIENTESDTLTIGIPIQIQGENN